MESVILLVVVVGILFLGRRVAWKIIDYFLNNR